MQASTASRIRRPSLVWDFIGGLQGRNDAGKSAVAKVLGENSPGIGPGDALAVAQRIAADTILFFLNPQRVWEQPDVVQGIWNLRDVFKAGGQMLVLVTPPGATLPVELQNDVMVIDEPLPSTDDLARLVAETFESASVEAPDDATVSKAVDALVGLAAFPAEQVLAMSLSKNGLDLDRLWERKCQAVEQTPGLTIWRGGETFDQIGGCENIKRFLTAVLQGREAPRVIVFVDEIEKAFAGTGTDMSGVKTEMTGTMLSWMQDRGADGLIFIGPPGAAKSAVGKAAGATAGIPTVAFDLSAMQNSLVGGSGERLRAALQVVDAISQGRSLWIATCNSITSLPPELRRRFTLGTFFFDLPSADERKAIWDIYRTKWSLTGEHSRRRRLDRRGDQGVWPESLAAEALAQRVCRIHRPGFAVCGRPDRSTAASGLGPLSQRVAAGRLHGRVSSDDRWRRETNLSRHGIEIPIATLQYISLTAQSSISRRQP